MSPLKSMLLIEEKRAISNLYAIASLNAGEKITCDQATGEIKKDDRVILVTFRRGYYGAYDSTIVQKTFEKAMETLREKGLEYTMEGHRVVTGLGIEKLEQLFEKALDGLAMLEKTYEDEEKNRGVKKIEEQFRREIQTLKAQNKEKAREKPVTLVVESDAEDQGGGLFISSDDHKALTDREENEGAAPKADFVPVEDQPEVESETPADEEKVKLAEDGERLDETSGEDTLELEEGQGSDRELEASLGQLMMEDLAELADETTKVYRNVVNGTTDAIVSVLDWFADSGEEHSVSTDRE